MATTHQAVSFQSIAASTQLTELIPELNRRFALLQKALAPVVGTLGVDNATPSIAGSSVWTTANTTATNITAFLDGIEESSFILVAADTHTTLVHSTTLLVLTGGVNLTLAVGDVLQFVTLNGRTWRQVP